MRIYQNKNNHKLIVALQWTGSKKLYKYFDASYEDKDAYSTWLPESELANIDYDDEGVHYRYNLGITDISNSSIDLFDEPKKHIVQIAKIGDYLIYHGNSQKMRYTRISKNKFEKNYKLYPIIKPTPNHTYLIQRLTGEYSDSANSTILIVGSKKQGQKLVKFLNKLADYPHYEDYYLLFKMPNNNELNFEVIE